MPAIIPIYAGFPSSLFRWSCVPLVCPLVCVLLVWSWSPDNHTHAHTRAHGDF